MVCPCTCMCGCVGVIAFGVVYVRGLGVAWYMSVLSFDC